MSLLLLDSNYAVVMVLFKPDARRQYSIVIV
jgi:hypothetical protein